MSAMEKVLLLLMLTMMTVTVGLLFWANIERTRIRKGYYGLPRCQRCRHVYDAHTNIGACPDGSGHFYED